MKSVPAVVHNLPHPGYRFEKWPSLPFAESCFSQYSCRRAGWRNSGLSGKRIDSWTICTGTNHSILGGCETFERRVPLMRGQNETRRPIVDSCSPRAVGSRPCPMVVRNHCRNCSDRLIRPPYSVHLQASALRMNTGLWPFNNKFCKSLCAGSIPARETIVMTIADGKDSIIRVPSEVQLREG